MSENISELTDLLRKMEAVNSDIQGTAIVSIQGLPICSILDGIIILSKAGENAILCTLAKADASLGMVFLNIQSVSQKIAQLLD